MSGIGLGEGGIEGAREGGQGIREWRESATNEWVTAQARFDIFPYQQFGIGAVAEEDWGA